MAVISMHKSLTLHAHSIGYVEKSGTHHLRWEEGENRNI